MSYSLKSNSVAPVNLAPFTTAGGGIISIFRFAFSAGAGGSADDVTLLAATPFPIGLLEYHVTISTAVGGSTVQVRTATGGGGSALGQALSTAATGLIRETTRTAGSLVAAGTPLILRRSDSGVAGQINLFFHT